jgi:RNA-directed DNA polymerase
MYYPVFITKKTTAINSVGGTKMIKTKPFTISKDLVLQAYLRVKENRGSAGIDGLSLEEFDKDRRKHLYRLWNRMSSGSYMPCAVLLVEIPKKTGGKRPLGIPTITDRIAQTVVTMTLEPDLDKIFHEDSHGYRPGKSALEAVGKTRQRCWRCDWVLDLDIKGFFDNIPHDLLMKAVRKHTDCKWVLLYIERWLKAAVQQEDGTLTERTKGTPQGAVISPLLANLFLHYCMDEWLRIKYPQCPFERYADDSVIHCQSKEQAEQLKEALQERLKACGLEMHRDKTRIVYCKDEDRNKSYPHVSFDFLGYTFRSRKSRNRQGKFFTGFLPAVSNKAGKAIREKIREWKLSARSGSDINTLAAEVNPVLRGWINYYGHYYKSELQDVLKYLNLILKKWARQKYKKLHSHKTKASKWLVTLYQRAPYLFAHWRIGVRP